MHMKEPFQQHPARCTLYLRSGTAQSGWEYERVMVLNPDRDGNLVTYWPPAVGDLVNPGASKILGADATHSLPAGASLRVVDRNWHHSSYGSADWPHGETEPKVGPLVTIVVEADPDGIYPN